MLSTFPNVRTIELWEQGRCIHVGRTEFCDKHDSLFGCGACPYCRMYWSSQPATITVNADGSFQITFSADVELDVRAARLLPSIRTWPIDCLVGKDVVSRLSVELSWDISATADEIDEAVRLISNDSRVVRLSLGLADLNRWSRRPPLTEIDDDRTIRAAMAALEMRGSGLNPYEEVEVRIRDTRFEGLPPTFANLRKGCDRFILSHTISSLREDASSDLIEGLTTPERGVVSIHSPRSRHEKRPRETMIFAPSAEEHLHQVIVFSSASSEPSLGPQANLEHCVLLATQFGTRLCVLDIDLCIAVQDLHKLVETIRHLMPALRHLRLLVNGGCYDDPTSRQYWDAISGDSAVKIANETWDGPLERLVLVVDKPANNEWPYDEASSRYRTPYFAIARNVAALCNNRTNITFQGPNYKSSLNMSHSEFRELVYWLLRCVSIPIDPPLDTVYTEG